MVKNRGERTEVEKYCRLACEQHKDQENCIKLGSIELGKGNIDRAKELWKVACEANFAAGCVGYASSMTQSSEDAKRLYGKACQLDAGYCSHLGEIYKKEGNRVETKKYYKKACFAAALQDRCEELGELELEDGNIDEAKAAYKKACDSYSPCPPNANCIGQGYWACKKLEELRDIKSH